MSVFNCFVFLSAQDIAAYTPIFGRILHDYCLGTMTTDLVKRRGRGRLPKSKPTHHQETQSIKSYQFINTAHPDDTTSSDSIKMIRSHAAKQSQNSRRHTKNGSLPTSQTSITHDSQNSGAEDEDVTPDLKVVNGARYVKLVPKRQRLKAPDRPELEQHGHLTSPVQLIGGARKDGYMRFARPLSEDEQYLFDFCEFVLCTCIACCLSANIINF